MDREHKSHSSAGRAYERGRLLDLTRPVAFAYNGGIGDRLCNLPALRALESLFPGRLALVCGKGDQHRFYGDLNVRGVHEVQFRRTGAQWRFDSFALATALSDCDLFLSLNPWHGDSATELLQRLPGVESIGFFAGFGHHLACDYRGHAVDMAFAVPAYLDARLRAEDFSGPPAVSESASATARAFLRQHAKTEFSLFVHMDSKPEKRWPYVRFAQALQRFLSEFPSFTAFVVDVRSEGFGPIEFPDRVVPFSLSLDTTLALLRECDLFLGVDSCHLHAADLFRVPGVALFGPTNCRRWGYRFADHWHLQGGEAMETIGVKDVCEALSHLVGAAILPKLRRLG